MPDPSDGQFENVMHGHDEVSGRSSLTKVIAGTKVSKLPRPEPVVGTKGTARATAVTGKRIR